MFKLFLTLALFFFVFSFGCAAQNSAQILETSTPPARISDDPFLWDFGTVKEGALLEHAFTLKNASTKTINIKDISTSCGCTVSQAKKKELLPGESTRISVKFNSKGYLGQTSQFIYVNTDNLDNPVVRFIIKADVVK